MENTVRLNPGVKIKTDSENVKSRADKPVLLKLKTNAVPINKCKLSLLCYNLFMRPPPVSQRGNDYKDDRAADFVKRMAGYDIQCFQEQFCKVNKRRSFVTKEAAKIGLKYAAVVKAPANLMKLKFPQIDSGVCILSRYPIIDADFRAFKNATGADKMAEKGVIYARVLISSNQLVHVFNTHPQAGYSDYNEVEHVKETDRKKYDKSIKAYLVRMKQIFELREFVHEKIIQMKTQKAFIDGVDNDHIKHAVIIMGDMNIDGRGPPLPKSMLMPCFQGNKSVEDFIKKDNSQSFQEYDILAHIISGNGRFRVRNLPLEYLREHPVTKTTVDHVDENGKEVGMDNYYCDPEKHRIETKTLDYIFMLGGKRGSENYAEDSKFFAKIDGFKVNVNKFTSDPDKQDKYNQLSDHWALEAKLALSMNS